MKTFTYYSKYCNYKNCYFEVSRYTYNNNLAVLIMNNEEGPIASVTVNTVIHLPDDWITIKDYSENTGMVDWLMNMNMIEGDPVKLIPSGFVIIPVYKLTDEGKNLLGIE